MNKPNLETVVEKMKLEILHDMAIGQVPITVTSFTQLHDYVDANEYGGFCDNAIVDPMIASFGGRDEHEGMPDGFMAFMNAAQDAINAWLETSDPKRREVDSRIWIQTQAPAGNWVDTLGSPSLQGALDHADFLRSTYPNAAVRVAIKTLTLIA